METHCVLIKLKPNCKEKVLKWAEYLNKNKQEVTQSLVNEGVIFESAYYSKIDEQEFMIYLMTAKDFNKAREVAKNSTLKVDDYHKVFKKECWESVYSTKNLINFEIK